MNSVHEEDCTAKLAIIASDILKKTIVTGFEVGFSALLAVVDPGFYRRGCQPQRDSSLLLLCFSHPPLRFATDWL